MEEHVLQQNLGVGPMRVCRWRPRHRNNISNKFWCFTNYASARLQSIVHPPSLSS